MTIESLPACERMSHTVGSFIAHDVAKDIPS
jgi:hypothetical protein